MRLLSVLCLIIFCLVFSFSSSVYADDVCKEHQFKVNPLPNAYTYLGLATQLDFTGCFPDNRVASYSITIGNNKCVVLQVSTQSMSCTFNGDLPSSVDTTITLQYLDETFGAAVDLIASFTQYAPKVNYATPHSSPLLPGVTKFRLSIEDFPDPVEATLLYAILIDNESHPITLMSQKDGYVTLQLPANFPLTGGSRPYTLTITDTKMKIPIFTLSNFMVFFLTTLQADRYIIETSPDWILQGATLPHIIKVKGEKLATAQSMVIYHPFTREVITAPRAPEHETVLASDVIAFVLPPFDFENLEQFPKYDKAKYGTVTMYRGPARYQLLDSTDKVISSSELTVTSLMKTTTELFPSNKIPANCAMEATDDEKVKLSKVSISVNISHFPHDLPARIVFDNGRWALPVQQSNQNDNDDAVETVGHFFVRDLPNNDNKIHFLLPACGADCKFPYTAKICLSNADSFDCILDLGTFTYLEAQQQVKSTTPTFLSTRPSILHFDTFGIPITSVHLSLPANEPAYEDRIAFRHTETKKIIELDWRATNKHLATAILPKTCAVPGKCDEGLYEPVYFSSMDPQSRTIVDVVVDTAAKLNLSFDSRRAFKVGLLLNTPFDRSKSEEIMTPVINAIIARFPQQNNIFALTTDVHVPPPTSFVRDQITLTDDSKTMAFFIIRPLSTNGFTTAEKFREEFQTELADTKSTLYTALPTLSQTPSDHVYIPSTYCNLATRYIDEGAKCEKQDKDEEDKDDASQNSNRWILILLIIVGAIVALGVIAFIALRIRSRHQKQDQQRSQTLLDDSAYYEPI